METMQFYQEMPGWVVPVVLLILVWDTTWKLIGLWKSAINRHLVWFICIGIFNTMGILPIVYVLMDWRVKKRIEKMSDL